MTWRDIEKSLNFVFCNDGRVVDKKKRDGDESESYVEDASGYEKSGV
jgi:hypothetical protein